jgi:hypothetical protein
MFIITALGSMTEAQMALAVAWAAVEVTATTLAVKDILAARRRAREKRAAFPWSH